MNSVVSTEKLWTFYQHKGQKLPVHQSPEDHTETKICSFVSTEKLWKFYQHKGQMPPVHQSPEEHTETKVPRNFR